MCTRRGATASALFQLTTSYPATGVEFRRKPTDREGFLPMPPRALLETFNAYVEDGSNASATISEVTWYWASDSVGERPITDEQTTTWVDAQSAPANSVRGGWAGRLEIPFVTDTETNGVYLFAKLASGDDGSDHDFRCKLSWRIEAAEDLTPAHRAALGLDVPEGDCKL